MGLFRRRKPLHVQLAERAGFEPLDRTEPQAAPEPPPDPATLEEQFFGERSIPFWERLSGEVANARPRRWDAVATAEADLQGTTILFVALPDGSLLVEEGDSESSLDPLAQAVEEHIKPPYRAQAVRQSERMWAVAANRIRVETFRADGDEIDVVVTDSEETLTVDGQRAFGTLPALERLGEAEGPTYHARATRLDGDLWEVVVSKL